ncbi:hypothetical protein MVEN_00902400 [Mycena venus]|uniref:Kinesin light chain n=1 Tax=Mycena venus TaxID=2733690 RepID=A0A8H6YCF1_9AGAR|nr:hypothetical protein MVEN_00902400 [Mycena venus]
MNSSRAVVPWNPDSNKVVAKIPENSRPESGKWAVVVLNALLSPSPGRTLDRMYTSLGTALEKQANRAAYTLGLGPHVIAQKIKSYFGNGEERIQQLELLRTSVPPKLEKKCLKLMKYTLPAESTSTQCQAFKDIIDLVALFPGLRRVFLGGKLPHDASTEAISAIWDRPTLPDEEWVFWKLLAATSLSNTSVSMTLEESTVPQWTACQDNELSVIERLWVEYESSSSKYASALCIRYLGGILDLPGFWAVMGGVHSDVARKLCGEMVQVLKDIGVDVLVLGLFDDSEPPFDYYGIDFMASRILDGLFNWFEKLDQEDWPVQPWYESFTEFLRLLRMPRASELLPNASACATNTFEDILPAVHRTSGLNVMANGDHAVVGNEETTHSHSLADLEYDCDTAPSLHSEISSQNEEHCIHSCSEDEGDSGSQVCDMESVKGIPSEPDISCASNFELDDTQLDEPGCDVYNGQKLESELDTWQNSDFDNAEMHETAWMQNLPSHSISYPSPQTQRKKAEEWKMIFLQNQRELGNDHPDTLWAMENLGNMYYLLGDYRSATDLRVVILEKQKILLGEDHPDTLRSMNAMGSAYYQLGEFKKAEEVEIALVKKCMQFLGEDNPDTLRSMCNLASTYRQLCRYTEAENLQEKVLEKQKQAQGEEHPQTLQIMRFLAETYSQQGKFKDAAELVVLALQRQRKILDEDHPDILQTMSRLASAYFHLGQVKKAEELELLLWEKYKRVLGADHPTTLQVMEDLARTYSELNQLSIAEAFAVGALEKQIKILGDGHYDTVFTMSTLAEICMKQGQFERAAELYVPFIEKWKKLFGDNHVETVWAMHNLASTYRSLGQLQDAEELEQLLREQEV